MIKRIIVFFSVIGLVVSVAGQKGGKHWTEWSKKDAEKTLNDSAWGQTQSEGKDSEPTSTSAITQVAAPRAATRELDRTGESGESKPSMSVKYRVRFLTAKPIREGFARMVLLSQAKPSEELTSQLQSFVDRDFGDHIVVAMAVETSDKRLGAFLTETFSSATAEMLQNKIYLERKDGKRLFLTGYQAPSDIMGAKFIFQRTLDGQPFLTAESDTVRFVALLGEKIKLSTRYKLSEMMYGGKLEY